MGIKHLKFMIAASAIIFFSLPSFAQEETYLKVGGDYKIDEIRRLNDHDFRVIFVAKEASGKFDKLSFTTKHLHVGISVGQTMRISADVLESRANEAEVAQLVIFVPSPQGLTPIWMLSTNADPNLGAKSMDGYLKLHAPQSDYLIF